MAANTSGAHGHHVDNPSCGGISGIREPLHLTSLEEVWIIWGREKRYARLVYKWHMLYNIIVFPFNPPTCSPALKNINIYYCLKIVDVFTNILYVVLYLLLCPLRMTQEESRKFEGARFLYEQRLCLKAAFIYFIFIATYFRQVIRYGMEC